MKIKSKIYAEALAELMTEKKTADEENKISERFLKFVEKNGDLNKLKEIVALAEDLFIKKTGRRKIIVETARKTKTKQRELIDSIAQKGDIVNERINPEIIAGIKITINDDQLDLSMQKKIQNLFK